MPGQVTTTQQIDEAVGIYYNRVLLERALPALVHDKFAQRVSIKRKAGKTIKWRRYSSLTPAKTPLSEGFPPPAQTLAKTDLLATVSQYGTYVAITDWLDYTIEDNVLNETADLLGENFGETHDELLRDVLCATASYYACTGGNNGKTPTEFSETDITNAVIALLKGRAKMISEIVRPNPDTDIKAVRKAFWGIMHTDEITALEACSGFINTANYPGQQTVDENEWGAVKNTRWLITDKCKTVGSSPTVYHNLLMGKNAYGIVDIDGTMMKHIFKPFGSGGVSDPLDQQATMGWKSTFTARILNDAFILILGATNKAGT